jgi:hypothetical protein
LFGFTDGVLVVRGPRVSSVSTTKESYTESHEGLVSVSCVFAGMVNFGGFLVITEATHPSQDEVVGKEALAQVQDLALKPSCVSRGK